MSTSTLPSSLILPSSRPRDAYRSLVTTHLWLTAFHREVQRRAHRVSIFSNFRRVEKNLFPPVSRLTRTGDDTVMRQQERAVRGVLKEPTKDTTAPAAAAKASPQATTGSKLSNALKSFKAIFANMVAGPPRYSSKSSDDDDESDGWGLYSNYYGSNHAERPYSNYAYSGERKPGT